jgi:hypothetical protein
VKIPLQQIHQIEITSRCNLRCKYCAHPTMTRAKVDMEWDVFVRAIEIAKFCQSAGSQGSLNLAGIGESTMHPQFVQMLAYAREHLGKQQELVLATNGLLMNDALAQAIEPYQPKVFVSLHRPERAGPAIEALKRVGLLAGVSADPSVAATDWAGQIKWHVSAPRSACPWVKGGWGMVLSDGRITRCSFDATGVGVYGHVNDTFQPLTSPYALCKNCHQDVGVPFDEALPEGDTRTATPVLGAATVGERAVSVAHITRRADQPHSVIQNDSPARRAVHASQGQG